MRHTGWIVLASGAGVAAVWLLVSAVVQPRPSLAKLLAHLHRSPPETPTGRGDGLVADLGRVGLRSDIVRRHLVPQPTLRLIGRTAEVHVGTLLLAAAVGFVAPSVVLLALSAAGVVGVEVVIPAVLAVAGALIAPLVVQVDAVNRAAEVHIDLRYQLSAYLDLVSMLLAGNMGHEGALEIAADAGDGLLFGELRRRMREVSTSGRSLVDALGLVAEDFELAELEQVASTTELSVAEGAPVARTLSAKCATLRSTIAADQEATARVRTDKVTPPLVGMALLFMALIVYPALNLR